MTREEYLILYDEHFKYLDRLEERGKALCAQSFTVLETYLSGKTNISRVNQVHKRAERFYKKESIRLGSIRMKVFKKKVRDSVEDMIVDRTEKGMSREEAFREIIHEIPELDVPSEWPDWFPEFMVIEGKK